MDLRVVSSLLAAILGGTLFGYSIGWVSVSIAWYNVVSNCTAIETVDACEWVGGAGASGCVWSNTSLTCGFNTDVSCPRITAEGACKAVDACTWDDNNNVCNHVVGWSASEQGWVASTMIIGGCIGSFLAQPVVQRIGSKRALALTGVIATFSSIFAIVGWDMGDWDRRIDILMFFRVIGGVANGFAGVFASMYVGEVAPQHLAVRIGLFFQIFCTFGIFFAALMGYALHPSIANGVTKSDIDRFQAVSAILFVPSLALIPIGIFAVDPSKSVGTDATYQEINNGENNGVGAGLYNQPRLLAVGAVLGAVQQMSGINAIMNYVPNIANTVGVSNPFLSNLIVMIWNFVTTLVSIPLAGRVEPQVSYFAGTVLAAIACFITGIPTYPGVTDDPSVRNGFVIFGILMFIAAFEVGMGPCFYVLAQSIFPDRVRAAGCSFTMAVQFFFNILINYGFPVLVQAFSGGVSGNQKQGLAIMFFIFGGSSFVLIAIFKTMGIKRRAYDVENTNQDET